MNPVFTNQTYEQVLKIQLEFGIRWIPENRVYVQHSLSTKNLFNVYINEEGMYARIVKKLST